MEVTIRHEEQRDIEAIGIVILDAFKEHPHSNQQEAVIVEKLRDDSALLISLVAEFQNEIVGHIAFSEVSISDDTPNWYGLGSVSVKPRYQGLKVGTRLIETGLKLLKKRGAVGCVVLGEPEYYQRFGFKHMKDVYLPDVPPEYFLCFSFNGTYFNGNVSYHKAFS